jgi:hypothetical protein
MKQRVLTARATLTQRSLNPAYAFTRFIGTLAAAASTGSSEDVGINARSWEQNSGSNSSGPFGPGYGNTFPGDNGYGYGYGNGSGSRRATFGIDPELPAPTFRVASGSGAGLDTVAEALAAL